MDDAPGREAAGFPPSPVDLAAFVTAQQACRETVV